MPFDTVGWSRPVGRWLGFPVPVLGLGPALALALALGPGLYGKADTIHFCADVGKQCITPQALELMLGQGVQFLE